MSALTTLGKWKNKCESLCMIFMIIVVSPTGQAMVTVVIDDIKSRHLVILMRIGCSGTSDGTLPSPYCNDTKTACSDVQLALKTSPKERSTSYRDILYNFMSRYFSHYDLLKATYPSHNSLRSFIGVQNKQLEIKKIITHKKMLAS
ncbi:hypothetical protein Bpfe_001870 [Biomphalaria pfeifferi]|uniref:Uncharacterized protein n=1 Tax=Biomphalaria pfeifferi TaxID=112525 RepID=A0AAD8C9Q2_BIOPF|nr:hypothetical protein Bpfe_001870 [Biomphalaria pfeifferi]